MKPIKMNPSFRYGSMTPWGSNALRTVFGKSIPDEVTGEALELSAIPGLESHTDAGESLPELIGRYGTELTGAGYEKEFPLLLKLLAAKTPLSVQVHPDDAYARATEGKLGKTEAWVILQAEEGAYLLYGMKEGVSRDMLEEALLHGGDVEELVRKVYVKAGEVYYIPSGMVHAIGGGILLYEIQQSSDITYRLWDYNRTDKVGNKRPLHIRQSLDVIRPELKTEPVRLPDEGNDEVVELLNVPAFRLYGLLARQELAVPQDAGCFGILTALDALKLECEGEQQALKAGDTLLIPASCGRLTLRGRGRALLSMPNRQ